VCVVQLTEKEDSDSLSLSDDDDDSTTTKSDLHAGDARRRAG